MMQIQRVVVLVAVGLVLAATSSSRSTFILTATTVGVPPDALIANAARVLERNGFHRVSDRADFVYQYDDAPIWANLSSPSEQQLQIAFDQLRGGCVRAEAVDGAERLVSLVAESIERSYGPVAVTEVN